jgi:hypothetical protein
MRVYLADLPEGGDPRTEPVRLCLLRRFMLDRGGTYSSLIQYLFLYVLLLAEL